MKLKNINLLFFTILIAFSSCILPEKFTCIIEIKNDGSSTCSFKGTVVETNILQDIMEKQNQVSLQDEEEYEIYMTQLKDNSWCKDFEYEKNGRASIEFCKTSVDSNMQVGIDMQWFGLERQGDLILFKYFDIESDVKKQLDTLGYKMDGKVVIKSELPVVENSGQQINEKNGKYEIVIEHTGIPDDPLTIAFQVDRKQDVSVEKKDLTFLPEEYTCYIEIKEDGTYAYSYKGTVVMSNALEEIKRNGKLSSKDEAEYKEFCRIFESENFDNYSYKGNARAYIEYGAYSVSGQLNVGFGSAGEWFMVVNKKDQIVAFYPMPMIPNSREVYADGGYKPDGKIIIMSELPIIRDEGKEVIKKDGKYIISFNSNEMPIGEAFLIAFQM